MSELDVYTRAYIVDVVRHGQENRLPENVVSEKNYDALAARVAEALPFLKRACELAHVDGVIHPHVSRAYCILAGLPDADGGSHK